MGYLTFAAAKFKVDFMSGATQSLGKLRDIVSLEVWRLGVRLPY
jgi:hypothetical protein